MSLTSILPKPIKSKSSGHLWDVCSIASLTRNLVEGYLSLYYFGIEKISESEADLRFHLLQLHKNIEWYRIRKNDMDLQEEKQFVESIEMQKNFIKNHQYMSQLSVGQKSRVLRWDEMYNSKSDFEAKVPVCKQLTQIYRHLSNLSHPLPISIERINNENGRGLDSQADVNLCLICIMLARKYLAASVIGVADHFKELGNKFSDEIETIRDLLNKGF